jgi:hypothetical protein
MNAVMQFPEQADGWSRRRAKKAARLARLAPWMKGPVLETGAIVEGLETLIEPGDAVALEGDNQKQADFLSRALVRVDPTKLHDLHLLISSVSRPEHLTLFERGIAAEAIRQDLATSVAHPVRWYDALEVMRELGATLFIEMAPGHVSTHLVAALFPSMRAVSIADQGLHYATVLAARENPSDGEGGNDL